MQILVDDEAYTPTGGPDQSLQALAEEVSARRPDGVRRLVVGLRCDGQEVPPDRLDEVLARAVSTFRSVHLQTQPAAALARATLHQARAILEDSDGLRAQIADHLDQGRHDQAMAALQRLVEVWKHAQRSTQACADALGIPLGELAVEGAGVDDALASMKQQLLQLKQGMEDRDFVLVGDVLRYEMARPTQRWIAILDALLARTL